MSGSAGWRIVYDGECRFCRWSLGWVLRMDGDRNLVPVRLDDPAVGSLLSGMSEAERLASWHLVVPDARVYSAGAAAPVLLRLLRGGAPLAAILERFPRVVEAVYRWVADHRGRFGSLIGDRALARADARIAARRPAPGSPPEAKVGR